MRTQLHLDTLTKIDDLHFINLVSSMGNDIFVLRFENVVSN